MDATTTHRVIDSPLGELTLVARNRVLTGLYFADHARRPGPGLLGRRVTAGFDDAVRQLDEYFAGARTGFDMLLAPSGSSFERRVWTLVSTIPYGTTRAYADLAAELGDRRLAQAVGAANARNPLCVVVPCHRLVGSDGWLTGYAGGLDRKRSLLRLEERSAVEAGRLF
jgi:methylated-DNA-[protein]-cysteine S-methyltransferase